MLSLGKSGKNAWIVGYEGKHLATSKCGTGFKGKYHLLVAGWQTS